MARPDLARLRHITRVLAKYGYQEFIKKQPDLSEVAEPGLDATPSPRDPGPRRLRLMLEELGPTFIKFGQVLSSRPDLIARAYVDELSLLQSECEPLPFADIRTAVAEGLRRDPDTLFRHIEEASLATASIAQVHRATTVSGEDVVIKVQRPGIETSVRGDIDILYRLARILDAIIEEAQITDATGIVREFEKALLEELDFLHEAANLEEFALLHDDRADIVIPRVYRELTSSSVLTMAYLDGVPLNKLPSNVDPKPIAERVIREAFDEVYIFGVFHADPHGGNLMLLKDGRYGIIDCGLLGRLTPQMRETLVVLALAVAVRDANTAARTIYRLGRPDARVSLQAVRDDVAELFERYLDRRIQDIDSTAMLQELLSLAMKHKIRVPAEYTMLGRAGATIEGIVRELDPDIDIAKVARPYAEQLLVNRASPDNLEGTAYRTLLNFQGLSQDLPIQVTQLLTDLSSGNFSVHLGGAEVEKLHRTVLTAATVVAGAILGAALLVGAFISFNTLKISLLGIPLVGLAAAIAAGTVFTWLSGYLLVRPRMRRIRLRDFVGRAKSAKR